MYATFTGFSLLNQAIFDQGYIGLNNIQKLNNRSWFFTGRSRIYKYIIIFGLILLAFRFSNYLVNNLNFKNYFLNFLYPFTSILSGITLTIFLRWKYVTRRVHKYKVAYLIGEFIPTLNRFLLMTLFYLLSKIFNLNTQSEINNFILIIILFNSPYLFGLILGMRYSKVKNLFGIKESKRFSYSFSTSLLSFFSRLCTSFASIISTSMPYQVSYFYAITTRISLLEQIFVSNIIPQLPKFVKSQSYVFSRFFFINLIVTIFGILFLKIFSLWNGIFIPINEVILMIFIITIPSLASLLCEFVQIVNSAKKAYLIEIISLLIAYLLFIYFKSITIFA